MYHGEQSYFLISTTLTKSTQSEMITSDSESSEDEDCSITGIAQQNIFQDMVHVALRTRQDLLDTPGHSGIWKGIDLAHVEQVIPNSFYFFLRLLFGSINVAHEGIEKDCEIDKTVCPGYCLWSFQQMKVDSKACWVRSCPASSYSLRGAR